MSESRSRRQERPSRRAATAFASLAGLGVLVKAATELQNRIPDGPRSGRHAGRTAWKVPRPFVALGDVRALPLATPGGDFPNAPKDRRPGRGTTGVVVHPRTLTPVFDRPGGTAFAALPSTLLGYETWLPVISYQNGWVKVLLPTRPGGVTGWLDTDQLTSAMTGVEIRIYLRAGRLHLVREGRIAGIWRTEPRGARNAISGGRTFLLAVRRDPRSRGDVPVLPLAQPVTNPRSAAGCASVVIHAGTAHDGCIGVPAEAIAELTRVPAGSLVRLFT